MNDRNLKENEIKYEANVKIYEISRDDFISINLKT
jgi:hypothetical protein